MNVLSLFDGLSCGQIALNKAGIVYDNYYASEIEKDSIKVTQHNYPRTIQLGDVCKIQANDLPQIDLLCGGSPCFVAGTKILTEFGYKNIEDIIVGDKVLSHSGNWRDVLKIGKRDNISTRLIKGYGNIGIETTDEHPFYIRTMYKKWNNIRRSNDRLFTDPEWISASKLEKKHYCATVGVGDDAEHDEDYIFWYMIGRYTGDGWYRKTKRLHRKNSYVYQFIICCGKHEFNELRDWFDKFGYNYNFTEERTGFKFRICSQKLVEIVEPIGKKAPNKRVHPLLLTNSNKNKKAYLDGLFDSDGEYDKEFDKYGLTTTSYELALGVQQLIADVYHVPVEFRFQKRNPTCVIEGRTVNQRPWYKLWYKTDKRKQDKAFTEGIYNWMPVKYNESTNEQKTVYNIEVDIDNSYTANNIVVHNCQSFSPAISTNTGFDGKSKLFFEYVRLLKECKPKYFLLENVVMKKEWEDVITNLLGVEPILINSELFSAQSRPRLYWTNIPIGKLPESNPSVLGDVLEKEVDKKYYYKESYEYHGDSKVVCATIHVNGHDILKRVNSPKHKCQTLTAVCGGNQQKKVLEPGIIRRVRKLTPREYERLQTIPENYTSMVSDGARYKMLGNGWTVDVIAHIFSGLI